ncbi:hypothetical protein [Shewanella sp. 10N.286.54.B9]|uniref:hypothetical protein n=1 Tax=Shewanella sp. 10N.286.54.B9 TaxID=3229719 RepID=UPI0035535853
MRSFFSYKCKIINSLIYYSPTWLITFRHELNHKENPSVWAHDESFFIHIPKSGGTSVSNALSRKESGHFKFSKLKIKFPEVDNKEVYYFIARNPIERIVSTYTYIKDLHRKFGTSNIPSINVSESLNDFIINHLKYINVNEHYFLRPFSEVIKGIPKHKLYAVNFDGLSENMSLFYSEVLDRAIDMPHSNKSSSRTDLYISKESKDILFDLYSDDFEIFNKVTEHKYVRL